MAYRYARKNRVWWPVDMPSRTESGTIEHERVLVLYEILSRPELNDEQIKLQKGVALKLSELVRKGDLASMEGVLADMARQDRDDEDRLFKRIHGWRDFEGDDGTPLPFAPELLREMLSDELLFQAFKTGLYSASRGAPIKNSSPGPGGTPAPAQS